MKKFFIALAVSLLAICFPDEFKGFLGIDWGTGRKACVAAMREKGWTHNIDEERDKFYGKTYGGKSTESVLFGYDDEEKLRTVFVFFQKDGDADRVFAALAEKYGLGYMHRQDALFTSDLATLFFIDVDHNVITITDFKYDRESDKVDESDL